MTPTRIYRHRSLVSPNLNSGNCSTFWYVHILTGARPVNPTLLPCPAWSPVSCHIPTPQPAFLFLQANLPLRQDPPLPCSPYCRLPLETFLSSSSRTVPCPVSTPGHQHPIFVGYLPTRKGRPELRSPSWLILQTPNQRGHLEDDARVCRKSKPDL